MADAQDTYVALPDGSYVQVPHDATPDQLSALRQKLGGQPAEPTPPPEMKAGEPETMTERMRDWWNAPTAGLLGGTTDTIKPRGEHIKQTAEDLGKSAAAAASTVIPAIVPGGSMMRGAGAGAGTYIAEKAMHGQMPSLKGTALAAGSGMIAGPLLEKAGGSLFGKVFGKYLPKVEKEAPAAAEAVEEAVGEGRPATWTNERVVELAKEGNRNAIAQANARGIRIPYVSEGSLPAKGSLGKIILTDRD